MLGISSFITQISIVIVIAVANNMIVKYGALSKYGAEIPLSVVGIVMKVFAIVISIVIGVSIGKPIKSMILSLARDIVIFIPTLMILASIYGVVGMLFSAIIADVISFVIAVIIIWNHNKTTAHIIKTDEKVEKDIKILPKKLVITIAREYGSGGRYVGQLLAKELKIKCYDKEMLSLTSKETGLAENYIEENEQLKSSFNIYYNNDDEIFIAEKKIIQSLSKEPCVIIGRCADYILQGKDNVYKIFLYSDLEHKIKRGTKYYGLKENEAIKKIKKIDRARAKHYEYYTNQRWKDFNHYDLAINVDKLGVLGTVYAIKRIIDHQ